MRHFRGRDGVEPAYRETGTGRPPVLLHGLAGDSSLWTDAGHAATLTARGHRVITPDPRGHGTTARSHEPARP